MNNLCKEYISNVKAIFPIMGKPEKQYIQKLSETIDEYCFEESIESIESIYNNFGHPHDIFIAYFSAIEPNAFARRLKLAKYIKRSILALIIIILISAGIYCYTTIRTFQIFEEQQIFFEETTIR